MRRALALLNVLICCSPGLGAAAGFRPGPSAGLTANLKPGEIREFWVKDGAGADLPAKAVVWTLSGAGRIATTPEGSRVEYRAPRAGGSKATLIATDAAAPARQLVFTLAVTPNPAPPAPARVDLLGDLVHLPAERNQGHASNCFVWASTAAIELELQRRYGIKDRLSIQYFTAIYRPLETGAPADPLCPNNFSAVLEQYKLNQRMVPWSNPNANFLDGGVRCGDPRPARESIGLLPNYRVRDLTSQQIETKLWSDEDVIEELKHVLAQGRAIISKMGGHYTALVGYEASDPDPLKHHWKMLDSLGVSAAKPDGWFLLAMRPQDYNAMDGPGEYHFQFDYIDCLDLDLQPLALPVSRVQPERAAVLEGQPLRLVAGVGGRPPVTYQWHKDGHPLPGQTGSVLALAAAGLADAGSYTVQVANAAGAQASPGVPVTVLPAGTRSICLAPGSGSIGAGATRQFRATLTGVADPGIHWSLSGGGQIQDPAANPVTYLAPAPPAPATLRATSVADPSLTATVTLAVQSADLNGDGQVDVLDLALLAKAYRATRGDANFLEAADLNGDGLVDDEDANALLAQLDAEA